MNCINLQALEREASKAGFLLRVQVRRPLGLWIIRIVVAKQIEPEKVIILGEMKAWAYSSINGFQLDTMRVSKDSPPSVGHLIWTSTMAWVLEATPCRKARLLAIRDNEKQNLRLVRYFSRRGFHSVREVGASPLDLLLRIVWGGAGTLMTGDCKEVLMKSYLLWQKI